MSEPLADGYAHVLADHGPSTEREMGRLFALYRNTPDSMPGEQVFMPLAAALHDWDDECSAKVIAALADRLASMADSEPLDTSAVAGWIRENDKGTLNERAEAVIDCIKCRPPEDITILKLLSRAGSQKRVFAARWNIMQRDVVLKQFIDQEAARKVLRRELLAHSLSNRHPNIIETHLLYRGNDPFLVERLLPQVLNDDWRPDGVGEAANLLRDISNALEFLRNEEFVHGDIKPDNIGLEQRRYILLDFGISRPAAAFDELPSPTGSLRTRAPELLCDAGARHSYASDIWALAATVYRGMEGRFPLIGSEENVPRIWDVPQRAQFEDMLAQRVRNEYDQWITFERTPNDLRQVLSRMLSVKPEERHTAREVLVYCHEHLSAYVRPESGMRRLSPAEEIEQLDKFLPGKEVLGFMPPIERASLRERLKELSGFAQLTAEQRQKLESVRLRLGES